MRTRSEKFGKLALLEDNLKTGYYGMDADG